MAGLQWSGRSSPPTASSRSELTEPWKAVEAAGGEPELISLETRRASRACSHDEKGDAFAVDRAIDDVGRRPTTTGSCSPAASPTPTRCAVDERAVELRRGVLRAASKPVGVICHGPWMLVEADVVRGRTLTSWPSLQTDIRNAGGDWVDRGGRRRPAASSPAASPTTCPAFCAKLVEELAAGPARRPHERGHRPRRDPRLRPRARAARSTTAALAPLGFTRAATRRSRARRRPRRRLRAAPGADDFAIHEPIDEPRARHRRRAASHIAFRADERRGGGRVPRGGRRDTAAAASASRARAPSTAPGYHGAFVLDPDGNNVEAVWHAPSSLIEPA